MYVRCNPNKNNIKYLSYVRGYRDKNGKPKQVTVEKIGDWEDLIKMYDDPIKFFNEKELLLENQDTFTYSLSEELDEDIKPYNVGYIFLKKIYDELSLNDFFKQKQKYLNMEYSLDNIFKLLIIIINYVILFLKLLFHLLYIECVVENLVLFLHLYL